jgi:mono/diheme cytochrome c family protein
MPRRLPVVAFIGLLGLAAGCSRSATDLPPGDPAAGKQAFVDLGCYNCHDVAGGGVPAPSVTPAVELGGRTLLPPSDSRLQQDIMLPSSHFAVGYPTTQIMEGDRSRMPDYSKVLTKQQLANLIAFLRSRYERALPSPTR